MVTFKDPSDPSVFLQRIADLERELAAVRAQAMPLGSQPAGEAGALRERNVHLEDTNGLLAAENESLRDANTHLAALFESTQLGTVLIDRQLRLRSCNGTFKTIFRLAAAEAETPLDQALGRLEESEALLADARHVVASGEWTQRQVKIAQGGWYLTRILPWLSPTKEVEGAILTLTDINPLKLAETRVKLALTTDRMVWWDWEFASGTIAVYGSAECILGHRAESLPRTSEAWFAAVHPDDLVRVRKVVEECLAGTRDNWSVEHRFQDAAGAWRWVQNSGALADRDAAGRATRMEGLARDIHEARLANEEIRRDAKILAELDDVVVVCDARHRIVYVNEAYTRVFGWPREDAVGRELWFRLPPERHAEVAAIMDRVIAGEPYRGEFSDHHRSGAPVVVSWKSQRLVDHDGRPDCTVHVGVDVTAAKQAEQERHNLLQKLVQSQKMDTLGALSGSIAHEFNNVLTVIMGFTELALATVPDEHAKNLHAQVLKAGNRARDLVKRILAFSRFDEPVVRRVALTDVVGEAVKFARASLPSSIEISAELPAGCPLTAVDANQLHQVILNLGTNAAAAMPNRRGKLTFRVRWGAFEQQVLPASGVLPAGRYVVIDAEDNGSGMDPGVQKRIFEPFFTTKKAGEGTGLGLSVVRAIVAGHGGGIGLSSTPGVGTTFSLYFPEADGESEKEQGPARTGNPLPLGNGETIAIVDDEEDIRAVLRRTLQTLGYTTLEFPSAPQFLAAFDVAPAGIDLLITDFTMPGMTGDELLRHLRANGCGIPVLVITGSKVVPEAESSSSPFPTIKVLPKPFEAVQLARAVREQLGAWKGSIANPRRRDRQQESD